MDQPGKDTWRHKQAGAEAVVLSSPTGLGLIRDTSEEIPVPVLADLYFSAINMEKTEGNQPEKHPEVEIFRSTVHAEPLPDPGEILIAIMSDVEIDRDIPRFKLEETRPLAEFLVEKVLNRA